MPNILLFIQFSIYYQSSILLSYSSWAVYSIFSLYSSDDFLTGFSHGMIQWRHYYYWSSLPDVVGFLSLNDSSLITRDILLSCSMHQPLISNCESYIGIMITWLSLWYCISIPSIAMTLANLIDIYIFGILSISLLLSTYLSILGSMFISHWLLWFISPIALFLLLLLLIEFISIIFQSITVTNRLSINILAGGFLVNILFLCLDLSPLIDYWPWIDHRIFSFSLLTLFIFDFEILSFLLQLCIFLILVFVIIH